MFTVKDDVDPKSKASEIVDVDMGLRGLEAYDLISLSQPASMPDYLSEGDDSDDEMIGLELSDDGNDDDETTEDEDFDATQENKEEDSDDDVSLEDETDKGADDSEL